MAPPNKSRKINPPSPLESGKKSAKKSTGDEETSQLKTSNQKKIQEMEVESEDTAETEETEEEEDEEEESYDEDESADDDSDGFEAQSSSDEESASDEEEDSDDNETPKAADAKEIKKIEQAPRQWSSSYPADSARHEKLLQQYMHVDDLSSDDEDAAGNNTIGRVPLHWYDAFDHIGYALDGTKLVKRPGKDRIDLALEAADDPLATRRIYDMYNDREVILSEREIEIIRRIQSGAFAHPEFEDTPDYVDYFTFEKEVMPLSGAPEPKSRFVPSKWEMMKVMKIAKAMEEGKFTSKLKQKPQAESSEGQTYLIWKDEEDEILAESKRYKYHLPAPKMPLPGHAESYNPPEEYLLTEEERQAEESKDPEDRLYRHFLPAKYNCLRHVPAYEHLVRERFERCLDLYLCPRKLKKRLNIDPETLIPSLPSPRDLKPFPNSLCLQYLGHSSAVRCLSVSPDGQYLVSGSEDGEVKLWEVQSAFCRASFSLDRGPIAAIAWNPDAMHHLVAVAAGKSVFLISTGTGDADSSEITESHLETLLSSNSNNTGGNDSGSEDKSDNSEDEDSNSNHSNNNSNSHEKKKSQKAQSQWRRCEDSSNNDSNKKKTNNKTNANHNSSSNKKVGPRLELSLPDEVSQVSWHHKGDYLAVLAPAAGKYAVSVHQISKGQSQFPFNKAPASSPLTSLLFHPFLPCLVVVSQQQVKIFHLVEQKLVKKLQSGCKWLSSIDIHPSGDHLLVGSYDRRVVWFDLDLASTPYKTLKFHEKAVRDVKYHKRYPLMASASDDGSVHVFHCMVYSDLMRNPLIVPVKILRGHGVVGKLGVLSILFHPRQPWIFSAGADGVINLYQDL